MPIVNSSAGSKLMYPPGVKDNSIGTPYLEFAASEYQTLLSRSVGGGAGVVAPPEDGMWGKIRLAVPNNISSSDNFNYEQVSLLKDGGIAKIANNAMGGGKDAVAGMTDFFAGIASSMDVFGLQNTLASTTGRRLNPKEELLFNGPSLRSHTFTFNLFAKNQNDAENIVAIIDTFKKLSYPKTESVGEFISSAINVDGAADFLGRGGEVFVFPHQWSITMQPGNKNNGFPYIPMAFCTSISTNYSANGLTTLLKGDGRLLEGGREVETENDDYFQSIELTLTFQDIAVATDETIFPKGRLI